MSEIRKIIVNATSQMLDEPDENGIFKTTRFYDQLERELNEYIKVLVGIDAGMVVQDHNISEIVLNLSRQTSLTGRLQNAIATYLEFQSQPVITFNPTTQE